MKKILYIIIASLIIGSLSTANAAVMTFFGEDLGLGEGIRLPSHLNSDTARNDFLNHLINPGTETFESFTEGTGVPLAVNFGAAGTATLQGSGSVSEQVAGTNGVGRYPISGSNYWEGTNSFSIAFSDPVAAFGFYGIDIGDFYGRVTVTTVNGGTSTYTIPNTMGGLGGSVLYWGIIDTENVFTSLTFGNTAAGTDYFGFDDFTIGSLEQVTGVPEPATLLLFGAGLAGLAAARKRLI